MRNLILSCVFSLFLSTNARAYSVQPMAADFDPGSDKKTQIFYVNNTNNESIALEISLGKRVVTDSGIDTAVEEPDVYKKLSVFPPQMILKPKEKKAIRVTLLDAKENPAVEEYYRLVVTQVMSNPEKRKTMKRKGGVEVYVQFQPSLFIMPKSEKKDLKVLSAKFVDGKSPKLALELKNDGTIHELLTFKKIEIKSLKDDSHTTLDLSKVDDGGIMNLLAQHKRVIQIPWPAGLTKGSVDATFSN